MRILIVEDNYVLARAMEMELEAAGHMVVGMAADGHQAVEVAGATRPDLCLMDIQLAYGTCGLETAREIHRRYAIPSLFVTANQNLIDTAARKVALGCLAKPFGEAALVAAIAIAAQILAGEPVDAAPADLYLFA